MRRSEICALDWSEVDISERHLEVKGVKSKTRQRRLVTLQPPLIEFLKDRHAASGHLWSLSSDHYGVKDSLIAAERAWIKWRDAEALIDERKKSLETSLKSIQQSHF